MGQTSFTFFANSGNSGGGLQPGSSYTITTTINQTPYYLSYGDKTITNADPILYFQSGNHEVQQKYGLIPQFSFESAATSNSNEYYLESAGKYATVEKTANGQYYVTLLYKKSLASVFEVTLLAGNITLGYQKMYVGFSKQTVVQIEDGFANLNLVSAAASSLPLTLDPLVYSAVYLRYNTPLYLKNNTTKANVTVKNVGAKVDNQMRNADIGEDPAEFQLQLASDITTDRVVARTDLGKKMRLKLPKSTNGVPAGLYLRAITDFSHLFAAFSAPAISPEGITIFDDSFDVDTEYIQMQNFDFVIGLGLVQSTGTDLIGNWHGDYSESPWSSKFSFSILTKIKSTWARPTIITLTSAIEQGIAHPNLSTNCFAQGVCPDPTKLNICGDGKRANVSLSSSGTLEFSCAQPMSGLYPTLFQDCCDDSKSTTHCPQVVLSSKEYALYNPITKKWLNTTGSGNGVTMGDAPESFTFTQKNISNGMPLSSAQPDFTIKSTLYSVFELKMSTAFASKSSSPYLFTSGTYSAKDSKLGIFGLILFEKLKSGVFAIPQTLGKCNVCPSKATNGIGWYTCNSIDPTVCSNANQPNNCTASPCTDGPASCSFDKSKGTLPTFTCQQCDASNSCAKWQTCDPSSKNCCKTSKGRCEPCANPNNCPEENCPTGESCSATGWCEKSSDNNGNNVTRDFRIGMGVIIIIILIYIFINIRNLFRAETK